MHDLVKKTYVLLFCKLYALGEYHSVLVRTQYNLCAQQIFQVHSTQTDELMNSMFVYVPMLRRYRTYHVILEGWGDNKM